jgi:hypothetical protein
MLIGSARCRDMQAVRSNLPVILLRVLYQLLHRRKAPATQLTHLRSISHHPLLCRPPQRVINRLRLRLCPGFGSSRGCSRRGSRGGSRCARGRGEHSGERGVGLCPPTSRLLGLRYPLSAPVVVREAVLQADLDAAVLTAVRVDAVQLLFAA